MKGNYLFGMVMVASTVFGLNVWAEMPKIMGNPVIDTPQLLDWPADRGKVSPNLSDPTSNMLFDFHGTISSCDLVFSTEGNYHPALLDVWPIFLEKFKDRPLHNSFYTTSPPVVVEQIKNQALAFGNLSKFDQKSSLSPFPPSFSPSRQIHLTKKPSGDLPAVGQKEHYE